MVEGAEYTDKSTLSPSRMELGAPVRCVHNDKKSVHDVSTIQK